MVMVPIRNPDSVEQILHGELCQITRTGQHARKLKAGKKIQLYYMPRESAGCLSCLKKFTCDRAGVKGGCGMHTNHIGTVVITSIKEIAMSQLWPMEKDAWARDEGFNDFQDADDFFMSMKCEDWFTRPMFVITWNPEPIIEKWKG